MNSIQVSVLNAKTKLDTTFSVHVTNGHAWVICEDDYTAARYALILWCEVSSEASMSSCPMTTMREQTQMLVNITVVST
jgi:hypothetical protein